MNLFHRFARSMKAAAAATDKRERGLRELPLSLSLSPFSFENAMETGSSGALEA